MATNSNTTSLTDELLPAVQEVMDVESVVKGGAGLEFETRFQGNFKVSTEMAFKKLQPDFARRGLTLLFRVEDEKDSVLGVEAPEEPGPSNPWINLALFLATVLSVLFAGGLYAPINIYNNPQLQQDLSGIAGILAFLASGIPFAVSMMAILLAHEFGHFLVARYHKTSVSLPYFLPLPISILGTLGAFIRMKEPPRNSKVLLDIGIAGPLAGLAVALPLLAIGISLSRIETLPSGPSESAGLILEGNSLLYLGMKYLIKGELLPAPADFGGISPAIYWVRYFFIGQPAPFGGRDILVHPVAWAAWAGLLVTALNLIPAGQLDGGHLIYGLIGKKAKRIWPFVMAALIAFGFVWQVWWLWALLIFFFGRSHAPTLDEITPLDDTRKALAIFGLLVFVITFSPIPLLTFPPG